MEASRAQSFRSRAKPVESQLLSQYREIRRTSLALAEPFSAEDQMLQSMPDASPMKWHLAHTTWFFETFILSQNVVGYRPFDSRYKHLFNSYYKQLGAHPQRGSRGLMSRPSLDEVHGYRKWVDEAMHKYLERASEEAAALVVLGLNHEQQHQELILTDIKHALWSMPLRPDRMSKPHLATQAAPQRWIERPGGVYEIGHAGDDFAFDNERPQHEVLLQPFQIASRQVTNAEYFEFMQDNGYRRPELWLSDGWDAICAHGWNSPLYWEQRGSDWIEFTLHGSQAVDPAAPVCHVSYYEADAFARWRGARLPREEEWEVAATLARAADHRVGRTVFSDQTGHEFVTNSGEFLESGTLHPQPAKGDTPQWFGNVWEWTASPYVAYPGFVPAPGLVGEYNGKFMCNQFVLRGGSCATPASHLRASYRNFFPPHVRWQFMGIRLAK